jgi:hypothetical protein
LPNGQSAIVKRCVVVNPGRTLLTVILYRLISFAILLAHDATAPRIVLLTPKFFNGIFTEVEIILILFRIPLFSLKEKQL